MRDDTSTPRRQDGTLYLLCLLSHCTFTKAFCFASILVQNVDGMGKYPVLFNVDEVFA
jgi:hypothetical protein